MDFSSKIYIDNNKEIIERYSENEKFKYIDIYGDIETLSDKEKIYQIKHLFDKGTIKGSCIKDELYIINDKYGFYHTGYDWQFCEFKIIKEVEEIWGEKFEKIYYNCNPLKVLEVSDIYKLVNDEIKTDIDRILKEYEEEYYKNNENRTYFEFDIDKNGRVNLYLEYKDCCFAFEIKPNKKINIYLDGEEIEANNYWEIKDKIQEKYNKEIIKYLDKNITKINNGFLYNNTYYDNFENIKNVIELEDN